jgi:hypothetical protein
MTTNTFSYDYETSDAAPATGVANQSTDDTSLAVNSIDQNAIDNTSVFDTLQVGDSIICNGVTWGVTSISAASGVYTFGISPATQAPPFGVTDVTFKTFDAPTIVEKQTFAVDIRDAMYNVVTVNPFFSGYTFRKTKMRPVQANLLPFLGVYVVDEQMVPDGDANAGCIRFNHTSRIGFSVIQANNDSDVLEHGIDAAYQQIMSSLWTDAHLMNVLANSNPEGVGIESAIRGTRRHVFGNAGLNNETPIAELQYEVSCFCRSEWYPNITDNLDEIYISTGIKPGDTQDEMNQRQQIVVDITGLYEMTPTRKIPVNAMFEILRRARRS